MRQSLQATSDTRSFDSDFEIKVITTSVAAAQEASQYALGSMRTNYERVTGKTLEDVDKIDEYATEVKTALGDVELLESHFEGKSLADVDFEAVKKAIRTAEGGEKRKELGRVVESITKLEALGTVDTDTLSTEQKAVFTLIGERDELMSATRGDLFKKLYEAGSNLIGEGEWTDDSICPLCLSALDKSLKAHIDNQLEQYRSVAEKIVQIKDSWQSAKWGRRLALLEKAETLEVDEDDRVANKLNQRAMSGELTKEELDIAVKRLAELEASVGTKLQGLNAKKEQLEKDLPESLVQLTEQVEYGRQFKESVGLYQKKQKEETKHRNRLDIRERWRRFIMQGKTMFSEAETALSKAKIAAIDGEYKSMFKQIMNVGDVVPDLQRADNREDLHVQLRDFHGQHRLSARALLSESYRNALAISVFLAAALKHTGTPRFVVLDDVTSSFDAGHQFFLMELIRENLQQPRNQEGLQFIILSHDGLLEKYFDRLGGTGGGGWRHNKLHGSPPMGNVQKKMQDASRLKIKLIRFLDAGQVAQAEPLIRQYLEYKLQQIIRKVGVPVPIDFAIKDQSRMVSNCLDAITAAVKLHKQAGTLVLESQQVNDLDTAHVPALIGNWVSHYETGTCSSLSAPMLKGVISIIDDLAECFRFDDNSGGSVTRRWYRSLSRRT